MNNHPKFKSPTQSEIDRVIAEAQEMRAQYVGKWIRKAVTSITHSVTHSSKSAKSAH